MKLKVMDKLKSLPGPRYKNQGPGSGEEFREKALLPALNYAVENSEKLIIDMDSAPYGYPTSFLEEAFGGLARLRGSKQVKEHIDIRCTDEPLLVEEIAHYIEFGEREETPPCEPASVSGER